MEVEVGVVGTTIRGNTADRAIENEQPMNTFYLPFAGEAGQPWLYVRSAGDAADLVSIVRRTMQTLAPDLPRADVTAFSTQLAMQFRPWRLGATMFGIEARCALAYFPADRRRSRCRTISRALALPGNFDAARR